MRKMSLVLAFLFVLVCTSYAFAGDYSATIVKPGTTYTIYWGIDFVNYSQIYAWSDCDQDLGYKWVSLNLYDASGRIVDSDSGPSAAVVYMDSSIEYSKAKSTHKWNIEGQSVARYDTLYLY